MRKPPVTATPFTYRLARLSSTLHAGCGDGSDQPELFGQCTARDGSPASVTECSAAPDTADSLRRAMIGLHHARSLGQPRLRPAALSRGGIVATASAPEQIAELLPPNGTWSAEDYLWLSARTNHLVEFAEGFIEVLPMPTDKHQAIVEFLFLCCTTTLHAPMASRGSPRSGCGSREGAIGSRTSSIFAPRTTCAVANGSGPAPTW